MAHTPNRLQVVERADALTVSVHIYAKRHARRLAELSPGLRNQLLRSAVSISLNLSEACGYHAEGRTMSFLDIAIGSCNETERILTLASKLGVRDPGTNTLLADIGTVRALIYGFRRHLQRRS